MFENRRADFEAKVFGKEIQVSNGDIKETTVRDPGGKTLCSSSLCGRVWGWFLSKGAASWSRQKGKGSIACWASATEGVGCSFRRRLAKITFIRMVFCYS